MGQAPQRRNTVRSGAGVRARTKTELIKPEKGPYGVFEPQYAAYLAQTAGDQGQGASAALAAGNAWALRNLAQADQDRYEGAFSRTQSNQMEQANRDAAIDLQLQIGDNLNTDVSQGFGGARYFNYDANGRPIVEYDRPMIATSNRMGLNTMQADNDLVQAQTEGILRQHGVGRDLGDLGQVFTPDGQEVPVKMGAAITPEARINAYGQDEGLLRGDRLAIGLAEAEAKKNAGGASGEAKIQTILNPNGTVGGVKISGPPESYPGAIMKLKAMGYGNLPVTFDQMYGAVSGDPNAAAAPPGGQPPPATLPDGRSLPPGVNLPPGLQFDEDETNPKAGVNGDGTPATSVVGKPGQPVTVDLPPSAANDATAKFWDRANVTSNKGVRKDPITGKQKQHKGTDFGRHKAGTPIPAERDGTVVQSGFNQGGFGNQVVIRYDDGSEYRYAHNQRNNVKVGDRVKRGTIIGQVGSTGRSTGPHVHREEIRGATDTEHVFLVQALKQPGVVSGEVVGNKTVLRLQTKTGPRTVIYQGGRKIGEKRGS